MYAKASFSMEDFKACDSAMTECDSLTSMPRARALQLIGATTPVRVRVCWYTPSGSVSDSSELTTGYFLLLLLVMFAVILEYSMPEKALFLWEQRLLADQKVEVNRLNTDYLLVCELQWHSERIIVMSHSQQQDGVIQLALFFFVK